MHDAPAASIDERRQAFSDRSIRLGRAVGHIPRTGRRAKKYLHPLSTVEVRAHAIVAVMAELESFIRGTLTDVHKELNVVGLRVKDIRPCLRQLVIESHVQSLRDTRKADSAWMARMLITTLDESATSAHFPIPSRGPIPPLDGRTLTAAHIARIWTIYGLPGDPAPNPRIVGSLRKLSLARNDLAHGNYPVDEVFRGAGLDAASVASHIENMRTLVDHAAHAWQDWLAHTSYK